MEVWALLKLNPQSQARFVGFAGEWCPSVELYFPQYERIVRPHGNRRGIRVQSPVYPGYVFARVDNTEVEDVGKLTRLPVRAWWVRFGGIVETVPGSVIRTIRRYEANGELVREIKHVSPYRCGVRVAVHLDIGELVGTVVRAVNGGRFLVDLPIGRATVLEGRLAVV